jgi:hypothetical protein
MIPDTIGVATLATRLCGKVFGFVKRDLSGAKRRNGAASGERGAGKGAAALVPASAHSGPGARIALQTLAVHFRISDDPGAVHNNKVRQNPRRRPFILDLAAISWHCYDSKGMSSRGSDPKRKTCPSGSRTFISYAHG